MFDLDTCIHFDEVEVIIFVEEFEGSDAFISHGSECFCAFYAEVVYFFSVDEEARTFFDKFLVSTLYGAVSFWEEEGIAFSICEHLDFDMSRFGEIFFHEDGIVSESL